jgi:hypothetical protein
MARSASAFKREFAWQGGYAMAIRETVGAQLAVRAASMTEDRSHNTDFFVLDTVAGRVAARVRRPKYRVGYSEQFPIRAALASGAETELAKLLRGWGDYLFYAFAADERDPSKRFSAWLLADLHVFRKWHGDYTARNNLALPGIYKDNHDGTALRAYYISWLPKPFVLARHPDVVTCVPQPRTTSDGHGVTYVEEPDFCDWCGDPAFTRVHGLPLHSDVCLQRWVEKHQREGG